MCEKKGHIRPECPLKEDEQVDEQVEVDESPDQKQPKPKSNLNKKAVQFVATTTDDEGSSSSEVCATQFGFCTVATSPKDLQRLLLLDNQSTCDIFCNKALVTKVWRSKSSITVQGNGGSITTNTKAFVKNYGEVWFDTRAITNILSLKNVKKISCHLRQQIR